MEKIKNQEEEIGPDGGSERSGAGEDSSGNGPIIIVAWEIWIRIAGDLVTEWDATRVARGADLCRDEIKGDARIA